MLLTTIIIRCFKVNLIFNEIFYIRNSANLLANSDSPTPSNSVWNIITFLKNVFPSVNTHLKNRHANRFLNLKIGPKNVIGRKYRFENFLLVIFNPMFFSISIVS
jgi:hypothetical protein